MAVSFELAPASVKVPPGSRKQMEVINISGFRRDAVAETRCQGVMKLSRVASYWFLHMVSPKTPGARNQSQVILLELP